MISFFNRLGDVATPTCKLLKWVDVNGITEDVINDWGDDAEKGYILEVNIIIFLRTFLEDLLEL